MTTTTTTTRFTTVLGRASLGRVSLAAALLALAPSCFGQAPTSAPPVVSAPQPSQPPQPNTGVILTAGLSYTLLTNGPGNSVNVTKLDVALPITDRFSLIYNQYMIPAAQANIFIGGVRYTMLLSQLIKSAANSSLKLDPSKFRVYVDCGLGSRRDSISNARVGMAGACNGGFSYNPVSNLAISLEGGYIRTGAVTGAIGTNATRSFLFGTSPMIAPGVKLTF
jgi:hypothetical protein